MTHQGLAAKAVGAIMAAALIGGCTAAPTNSPTPTGPSQSPSPSPTVTPTPTLSPEDQKLEDAKARVVLLWQTLDGLLVDSSKSINELDTLASGEALSSLQVMLTTVRQRGQVRVTPVGGRPTRPDASGERGCPHGYQTQDLYPGLPAGGGSSGDRDRTQDRRGGPRDRRG